MSDQAEGAANLMQSRLARPLRGVVERALLLKDPMNLLEFDELCSFSSLLFCFDSRAACSTTSHYRRPTATPPGRAASPDQTHTNAMSSCTYTWDEVSSYRLNAAIVNQYLTEKFGGYHFYTEAGFLSFCTWVSADHFSSMWAMSTDFGFQGF